MLRQWESFEGTWSLSADSMGRRVGNKVKLTKVDSRPEHEEYELRDADTGQPLAKDLMRDSIAFTLKNNDICLSLWKDLNHLFAIEIHGGSFDVWGAVRDSDPVRPPEPDWRLDQDWLVTTSNEPAPPDPGDKIKIQETSERHLALVHNDSLLDNSLVYKSGNRTLDGTHRCVSLWDREAGSKNCLFAMVILPPALAQRIRSLLEDNEATEKIEKILGQEGLLPFEIRMLIQSIPRRSIEDDTEEAGVWGAEEG